MHISNLFWKTRTSVGSLSVVRCKGLRHLLDGQCFEFGICFCGLLCLTFLKSNASLTDFSFFTVIPTGLMNRSSALFSNLMICLFWISLFDSIFTFSRKCSGTLRPFCWFGIWFCLNIDLAIWFFLFSKSCE